jgi:hypothetical protein
MRSPAHHMFTLIALLLLVVSPAFAALVNGTTVSGNQLTILGTGFAATPLTVSLNGVKLSVVSNTATKIVATLNPVPPPGTYRLVVKAGTASTTADVGIPLPSAVARVSLTNQSSTIPLTALVTPHTNGVFRVSYSLIELPPCSGTSLGGAATLFWTDDRGAEEWNPELSSLGTGVFYSSVLLRDLSGMPLSYEIATGDVPCTPYDLFLTVEQLQ